MNYTGERMMPEASDDDTYWEHVFRYAFACQNVKNRRVLDIASGEGYGAYALSKVAQAVAGVDISLEAVEHAKKRYNLDYRVGSAEKIPFESCSFDAVVSFETIEHVPMPKAFVDEVLRVLKPEGLFIVSTPNKDTYRSGMNPNPFHCSELTKNEFLNLLSQGFEIKNILGQIFPDNRSLVSRIRRRVFRKMFLPYMDSADAALRNQFIDSIPNFAPPFSRFWNPFLLRNLKASDNKQPVYFVAVATKRNNQG